MEKYTRSSRRLDDVENATEITHRYEKDGIDPSEGCIKVIIELKETHVYASPEDVYYIDIDPNVDPEVMVLELYGTGDEVKMWRELYPDS